jgi:hypothetical protein
MDSFSFDSGSRAQGRLLLTVPEAAAALSVSERHIKRLIHEADSDRRSRWRWGRELINLAPAQARRRVVRVNVAAVVPKVRT